MKKISSLFIAMIAFGTWSCGMSSGNNDEADSTSVAQDSISALENSITGIAIDGAMNSITIVSTDGDTLNFGYSNLDSDKRASWSIGDTVTIRYIGDVEDAEVLELR